MAVTFAAGFEAQHAATDNIGIAGTAAYSTAQARTGAASVRVNPSSGGSGFASVSALSSGYLHFGLYIASMPSTGRMIVGSSGANHNLVLNANGTLTYRYGVTPAGTSTTALTTGTWYWIGMKAEASGSSEVLVQIDAADAVTGTSTVGGGTAGYLGCSGNEASAIDVYYDDYVVDDSGFLAPSKVDFALPYSTTTRVMVTTGDLGTSNLPDAINNTPPAGVASANETATSNIEFWASQNCDYACDTETYASLGVADATELIALCPVFRHGEDIATGTKTGTWKGLVSNPDNTETTAFTFGGNGGAHGAESGTNYWVTAWGNRLTTRATLDGVDINTGSRLEITRASESRVGCVDFMGLLVVWTPAATATNPPAIRNVGLQSVMRAATW